MNDSSIGFVIFIFALFLTASFFGPPPPFSPSSTCIKIGGVCIRRKGSFGTGPARWQRRLGGGEQKLKSARGWFRLILGFLFFRLLVFVVFRVKSGPKACLVCLSVLVGQEDGRKDGKKDGGIGGGTHTSTEGRGRRRGQKGKAKEVPIGQAGKGRV